MSTEPQDTAPAEVPHRMADHYPARYGKSNLLCGTDLAVEEPMTTAPEATPVVERARRTEITPELLREAAGLDSSSWRGVIPLRHLAAVLGIDIRTAREVRLRLAPLRRRPKDKPAVGAAFAVAAIALMLGIALWMAVSIG